MMPNTSAASEKQRIPPKMTRMNDKSLMSINMFVFITIYIYVIIPPEVTSESF